MRIIFHGPDSFRDRAQTWIAGEFTPARAGRKRISATRRGAADLLTPAYQLVQPLRPDVHGRRTAGHVPRRRPGRRLATRTPKQRSTYAAVLRAIAMTKYL